MLNLEVDVISSDMKSNDELRRTERIENWLRKKVQDGTVRTTLVSFGFSLFWVYGMLTIVAFVSSFFPISFLAGFAESLVGILVQHWILIALNNLLIFSLYLFVPFNLSIPFSGLMIGSTSGTRGIQGVRVVEVLLSVYRLPFAVLELGAYVLAITFSFYYWRRRGKGVENVTRRRLVVVALGTAMLFAAAILEI